MDSSTPGYPVFHYLLEFAQTHIHWVDGALQPTYPLLPSSSPALNLSQHQSLFPCVDSSYQVAKVLELHLQSIPLNFHGSVQFSHSVVSNSSRPQETQHAKPPCPSPTARIHSNSSLSQWCHPTISSSVVPFSSCLPSFPTSGSSQMSHFFASGGQSIAVSASKSVLPMNTQDWYCLGCIGWISLQSKDSQESSPTPWFKSISSLALSFLHSPTLTSIHDYWKNHSLD